MTAPAFAQPDTTFSQPAAGQWRPAVQGVAGEIASMVTDVIDTAQRAHPRHLQSAVGPSEIGTPCTRRLAYRILDWPRANTHRDLWLSTVGVAVHSWMADTFEAANRRLGRARYLVEQRVYLPFGISGSTDLFDTDAGDVIDWKLSGVDKIRGYRRNGPGQQYRVQAHLYGLGWLLAGRKVRNVADVFLPRGGLLATGMHVWTEPFDAAVATAALRRYDNTRSALAAVDPELHPGRWAMFPTANDYCEWCPFYLPMSADLGKGCPGHRAARTTAATTKESK